MKTFLPALAIFALFSDSLSATAADEAAPKVPDAKAGIQLIFQAYDGDPKRPEAMEFQINTLNLRQPTEFLQLGDIIGKTGNKLTKFIYKTRKNLKTGELDDVSELTIVNTTTQQESVLVLAQPVDSR